MTGFASMKQSSRDARACAPASCSARSFSAAYTAFLLTLGTVLAVLIFLVRVSPVLSIGLAGILALPVVIHLGIPLFRTRRLKAVMAL